MAPVICVMALRVASRGGSRFLGHDALDVLDHDDGVIDENADGEHHREQGQHVDGRDPSSSSVVQRSSATGTTTVGMMV